MLIIPLRLAAEAPAEAIARGKEMELLSIPEAAEQFNMTQYLLRKLLQEGYMEGVPRSEPRGVLKEEISKRVNEWPLRVLSDPNWGSFSEAEIAYGKSKYRIQKDEGIKKVKILSSWYVHIPEPKVGAGSTYRMPNKWADLCYEMVEGGAWEESLPDFDEIAQGCSSFEEFEKALLETLT